MSPEAGAARLDPGVAGPTVFILPTDKKLSAQEALEWGAVAQVLPRERLLDTKWELAREPAKPSPGAPPPHPLAVHPGLEALIPPRAGPRPRPRTDAQRLFFPFGAGMKPLDRPWDDEPWSDRSLAPPVDDHCGGLVWRNDPRAANASIARLLGVALAVTHVPTPGPASPPRRDGAPGATERHLDLRKASVLQLKGHDPAATCVLCDPVSDPG